MKVLVANCFNDDVNIMFDTGTHELVVVDHRQSDSRPQIRFSLALVLRTIVRFGYNLKDIT